MMGIFRYFTWILQNTTEKRFLQEVCQRLYSDHSVCIWWNLMPFILLLNSIHKNTFYLLIPADVIIIIGLKGADYEIFWIYSIKHALKNRSWFLRLLPTGNNGSYFLKFVNSFFVFLSYIARSARFWVQFLWWQK